MTSKSMQKEKFKFHHIYLSEFDITLKKYEDLFLKTRHDYYHRTSHLARISELASN